MTIVTLTIDPGTCGTDFAATVAAAVGYRLVDQTRIERLVADYGWTQEGIVCGFLNADQPAINGWPMTVPQFAYRLQELILSEAAGGNVVIAGWAAARILHGAKAGTRFHVTADLEYRALKIGRKLAYSDIGPAFVEIDHIDNAVQRYLATAFPLKHDVDDSHDRTIVLGQKTEDECVAEICEAVLASERAVKTIDALQAWIACRLDALRIEETPADEDSRNSIGRY